MSKSLKPWSKLLAAIALSCVGVCDVYAGDGAEGPFAAAAHVAKVALPVGSTFTVVSGSAQNLAPNTPSAPLIAQLSGPDGQPLVGRAIRAEAMPPASATLSATLLLTDAQGRVQFIATPRSPGGVAVVLRVVEEGTISVRFDLTGGLAFIPGLDPRTGSVAQAIDGLCPQLANIPPAQLTPGQRDLQMRCGEVVGAAGSGSASNDALGQLRADGAAPQATAAFGGRDVQFNNLGVRFDALRIGARRGLSLAGLNLQTGGGSLPLALLLPATMSANEQGDDMEGGELASPWGAFFTGQIGRTNQEQAEGAPGFDGRSYGLTGGVDYRLNSRWVLGGALGYDTSNNDLSMARGAVDSRQFSGTLYASWISPYDYYADVLAAYSRINFDLERNIRYRISPQASMPMGTPDTQVAQAALASPKGDSRSLAVTLGRDFHSGSWSSSGYLRAEITRVNLDGYEERARLPDAPGAGLVLRVDPRGLESRTVRIGARTSVANSMSFGVLVPSARLEWVREFQDDPQLITTHFIADPTNTAISFSGSSIDNGYGNFGFSLSSILANGRSFYLAYEHRFGQDLIDQDLLNLGGRIEF